MESSKSDKPPVVQRTRRERRLLVTLVLLLVFFLLYHGAQYAKGVPAKEIVDWIGEWGPVPFFIALAFLPIVGFPVTPFYLLAGASFGVTVSLVGTVISQAVNLLVTYWIVAFWLRRPVERLVGRMKYKIPEVNERNAKKWTVLIRIAPGIPNFLKNLLLIVAKVPFAIFFLVSLPITVAYAIGIIVFGDSLIDRNPWQAVGGAIIFLLLLFLLRLLRRRLEVRRGNRSEEGRGGREGACSERDTTSEKS